MASAGNRRRVTQVLPALAPVRLAQRRFVKRLQDSRAGYRYTRERLEVNLPWLVAEHSSILERDLRGVDPQLQRNKVQNLRLAAGRIDGVVLGQGETFSFWRLVGRATRRGGYAEGLVLRDGVASSGVGGGLCQISNMLHWLALHSDLVVTERHRHSFDPFPDSERRVPFGTGATLLEGIFDLKLTNPSPVPHQIRLQLAEGHLVGQLRCAEQPPVRYEVVERDHRFTREGDEVFRSNRLVRLGYATRPGTPSQDMPQVTVPVSQAELFSNYCRVGYAVADEQIS